jgi:membrane associated rhomboid family serine protease
MIVGFNQAIADMIAQFQMNLPLLTRAFAVLCGVHFLNIMMGYRLSMLGIVPRTWHGLLGIFWAPLLHANGEHLLSNALILMVLANMVAFNGQDALVVVTCFVVVVGGLLTWCFGRKALHIGASGVAMGYFGFVLIHAYHQPGVMSVGVACVALYYFSSLLMQLTPTGRHDSWEGHAFGFMAGLLASQVYPTILTWPWVQQWL